MPSPREIALKVNAGTIVDKAEQFVREQDATQGTERKYDADPTNPADPPPPVKNMKGR